MGSKGSSQPTTSTVNQTTSSVPPQLVPYVEQTLSQAETLSNQPYVPYGGQQVANQSPYTLQSYQQAGNLGNVGSQALSSAANTATGLQGIKAPTLNPSQYTMAGVAPVTSQSWTTPGTAQQYMSPYLNTALQSQLAIANQQFGQQQNQVNQQQIQSGAYGGARAGLQAAQNQANYNLQTQNMIAQAENNAYTTGQSAFQAGNSANLLAQEANQQAGLTTQNANLQAGLQVGETNASNYLNAANLGLSAAQAGANIGTAQQAAAAQGLNALYNAGQSAQNYQQLGLNSQYNNFINQQQYPEQQLNFLSGIEHGFNVSPNSYTQTVGQPTNPVTNLVGNGLSLSSLQSLLGGSGGATA